MSNFTVQVFVNADYAPKYEIVCARAEIPSVGDVLKARVQDGAGNLQIISLTVRQRTFVYSSTASGIFYNAELCELRVVTNEQLEQESAAERKRKEESAAERKAQEQEAARMMARARMMAARASEAHEITGGNVIRLDGGAQPSAATPATELDRAKLEDAKENLRAVRRQLDTALAQLAGAI